MSEKQDAAFIGFITARHKASQDLALLQEMKSKKESALKLDSTRMQDTYGMKDGEDLHFDWETRSLVRYTQDSGTHRSKGSTGVGAKAAPEVLHRFKSNEEVDRFRTSLSTFLSLRKQAEALRELVAETEAGIADTNRKLLADFGVDARRSYRYERETRSIFEVSADGFGATAKQLEEGSSP